MDHWKQFLAGHWQQERPTRPGRYAAATRQGERGQTVIAYEKEGRIELTTDWKGWFWSEPWPDLPWPPAWR